MQLDAVDGQLAKFYNPNWLEIEPGKRSARGYCLKAFEMLRDGRFAAYIIQAAGKDALDLFEKVLHKLAGWIEILLI